MLLKLYVLKSINTNSSGAICLYQIKAKLHENKNRFITITRELINYGLLQRVVALTFQISLMNIFDILPDFIFFSVHGCVICLPFQYCFICAWENEKTYTILERYASKFLSL